MATPAIDISLLARFSPVFIFLLSLVLVYALLAHTKPVGDQKLIYAVVALAISIGVILSPAIMRMIEFMAPWFTVVFIFLIFGIISYKIFGATDADIHTVIKEYGGLQWTVAIIGILIALGALSAAFGQQNLEGTAPGAATDTGETITFDGSGNYATETGSPNFQSNLERTFYHPKTLGILFVLVLSALTIALLTGKMTPTFGAGGGGHGH
ncbi:hypothetical protein HZA96_01290 [Candidatus Woesearchaeota archaeon]|nr:hypothetical protein [Candidatus Woesearchaeota archaeon]